MRKRQSTIGKPSKALPSWILSGGQSVAWIAGLVIAATIAPTASAGTIGYPLSAFTLVNTNADGSLASLDLIAADLTGGNNGSGLEGTMDLLATATGDATVVFHYVYISLDEPGFDWAGYLVDNVFTQLADTSGEEGDASFPVLAGQEFGFRVGTADNGGEPGIFTVSSFDAPSAVPEPSTPSLLIAVVAGIIAARKLLVDRDARGGKR